VDVVPASRLDDLVRELPPQIQGLIIMRFYGNLTQSQIAAEFDISMRASSPVDLAARPHSRFI
jgi:DNA-directed RNA polymerase specialized sigma24 family protein